MRIEQVSLRTLTVGIVSLLAVLAVLTLLLMAMHCCASNARGRVCRASWRLPVMRSYANWMP
jgi:hypothetical protein